jgi:glycosyltransferase involved in cell wall biosynthesis
LVPLKGFDLALAGFAQAGVSGSELWVVGDGPDRGRLEAVAAALGVRDRVRFLGLVSHEEAQAALGECDVLVHPSLHDSGGWVCLEAMAAGRPVICLDLGGPAMQVDSECGVLVRAGDPQTVAADIARAMRDMTDESRRRQMAESARKRAGRFEWRTRCALLTEVYSAAKAPSSLAGWDIFSLLGAGRERRP